MKKACVFTVKLAFSRFGKDIIRDERFGLKKEGLEWFGGPKCAPNELPERGEILKKVCVFIVKVAFSLLQGLDLSKWLQR